MQQYTLFHSPHGPLMVHVGWLDIPGVIQNARNARQRDWHHEDPVRRDILNARKRLAGPYPQRRIA